MGERRNGRHLQALRVVLHHLKYLSGDIPGNSWAFAASIAFLMIAVKPPVAWGSRSRDSASPFHIKSRND
jgi:hypothetical protein